MNASACELVVPPPSAVPPCLIVNPRSFRASQRGLARRAGALARRHGVEVIEAVEPAQIRAAMEELHARRHSRIFVLSGDGTVQAVVHYLASLPEESWRPELLILGGGRSNMTARDFGGVPAFAKLEAALRRCSEGGPIAVETRRPLHVEQEGAPARYGFLLAGARIDSGIRICRRHRKSGDTWIHTGPLADAYALGRLALQVALGRSPLPPFPQLTITAAGTDAPEVLSGLVRLVLATTLQHHEGPYNPYAARGEGAVRVTAVSATASGFWRRLPRLSTGRFDEGMSLQHGYLSGRYERVDIAGIGGYSLDGEAFEADAGRTLSIRSGPPLRILRP